MRCEEPSDKTEAGAAWPKLPKEHQVKVVELEKALVLQPSAHLPHVRFLAAYAAERRNLARLDAAVCKEAEAQEGLDERQAEPPPGTARDSACHAKREAFQEANQMGVAPAVEPAAHMPTDGAQLLGHPGGLGG